MFDDNYLLENTSIYNTEDENFIYERPLIKDLSYYRKKIKLYFYDKYTKFLLRLYNKKIEKINKKYYLSICAIFKNEAKNLKEWIEYHLLIGIEHFYLYNNFSEDNYKEILDPYIKKGIVSLKEWPIKQGQLPAYEDCYKENRLESQWICYIDLDEFICPYKEIDIKSWLKNYELYPSILVYWKMFGTSGKIERTKDLVIEEFYVSYSKLVNIGKCFLNTNFKIRRNLIHFIDTDIILFNKKFSIPTVNEYKKVIKYGINRVGKREPSIQINHYFTKTYNEYTTNKMIRGDAYFEKNPKNLSYFYLNETKNISCDYKIFRFLIALKNKLIENR